MPNHCDADMTITGPTEVLGATSNCPPCNGSIPTRDHNGRLRWMIVRDPAPHDLPHLWLWLFRVLGSDPAAAARRRCPPLPRAVRPGLVPNVCCRGTDVPDERRVAAFQANRILGDRAGEAHGQKEGERMNLASHSFDCPVKYDAPHDPVLCAIGEDAAEAHQHEIDWYERHLKQAQRERDEARAEVERLRAELRAC